MTWWLVMFAQAAGGGSGREADGGGRGGGGGDGGAGGGAGGGGSGGGGITAQPDPSGLPGSSVAEQLVNGLFFYTLLGCLAGLLVSILVWVFSSRAQNYHHAAMGRQGTLVAFLGALIAGAAPALINFFQTLGSQVR